MALLLVASSGSENLLVASSGSQNMNGNYTVANGHGFNTRLGDYKLEDGSSVEYFDVYSPPIRTRYGQVYWTMMEPVPLPDEIVKRFAGKTMAITGHESDQVIVTPGEPDMSVPITWAYNHHYEHHLTGKNSVLENVAAPPLRARVSFEGHDMGGTRWAARPRDDDPTPDSEVPVATIFSEGNGGEYAQRESNSQYPGFAHPVCRAGD